MAFNDADRKAAATEIARRIFNGGLKKTADLNTVDIAAAVNAVDLAMDALPATLDPTKTVKQNLVGSLPQPFKGNSNVNEKAMVLVAWVLREVGEI